MDDKVYPGIPIEIKQECDEYDAITNNDWKFRSDEINSTQNSVGDNITVDDMKNINNYCNQRFEFRDKEIFKTEIKQETDEALDLKHEMQNYEEFCTNNDSTPEIKDEIDIECGIEDEKTCYSCDECDFKTDFQCSLRAHIDNTHGLIELVNNQIYMMRQTGKTQILKLSSLVNKFRCHICEKHCNTMSSLAQHMRFTHEIVKLECDLCHMKFKGKHIFDEHMRVIHQGNESSAIYNGVKHVCGNCLKVFTHKHILDAHIDKMHNPSKHECGICHKSFRRKQGLYYHKRLHENKLRL